MTIRTLTLPKLYTIRDAHRRLLRNATTPAISVPSAKKSTWSTPPSLNRS